MDCPRPRHTRGRKGVIPRRDSRWENDIPGAKRRYEQVLLALLLTGFGDDIRGMGNAREIDREGWKMGIQCSHNNP